MPNFDETEKEPQVLPVKIPNLLVNGADGIAVGMATSIPPHNLGEVVDAVKAYIKNNDISVKGLMRYLKGPDFPTGGLVVNKDDLLNIYETGSGKLRLRGKVEVEKVKGGRQQLVITEIPYTMIGANIGKFLNDVASLVETKKDHRYCGYFQPVLQGRNPYCTGTEKGCRCRESHQHALQENQTGRHLRSQYAGCCRRTVRKP